MNCWEKLEKVSKEKLPVCVKHLLVTAAYDTLGALKCIDESKITEIETYLSADRSWVDELHCCRSEDYKKQANFRFLPGHRAIILAIPDQLNKMNEISVQSKRGAATQAKIRAKKEQTDDELRNKLIANLVAFMKQNECEVPDGTFTFNNIREFRRGSEEDNFICKCKFACPFCKVVQPLTFKTYWQSSNFTKHLKKDHIDIEYVDVSESDEMLEQFVETEMIDEQ